MGTTRRTLSLPVSLILGSKTTLISRAPGLILDLSLCTCSSAEII